VAHMNVYPLAFLLLFAGCADIVPADLPDSDAGDTDVLGDTDSDSDPTYVTDNAPVAVDDSIEMDQGDDATVEPLLNDTDPNGDELDPLTLVVVTAPLHGTTEIGPDGRIRYSHDGSDEPTDSFTYTVDDVTGETSNVATVDFTLIEVFESEFGYTGAMEVFEAPITGTFTLEVWGAQGAGGNGGKGGHAVGEIDLLIGEVVNVFVGGQDGYNGGGAGWAADARNGGGASDMRMGGDTLAERILVAGGGGSSSGDNNFLGGAGGGGQCAAEYCGGGGGLGYSGGDGIDGGLDGGAGESANHSGGAGGGGFQSGGLGSCNTGYTNTCGTDGVLGMGGAGDTWENGICFNTYGGTSGGGGGYYGGGGTSTGNCGGGGGGGGSSWTGTLANPVMTAGAKFGDGGARISW